MEESEIKYFIEAALLAAKRDKEKIEMVDFDESKDKVYMGLERKSKVIKEEDRKTKCAASPTDNQVDKEHRTVDTEIECQRIEEQAQQGATVPEGAPSPTPGFGLSPSSLTTSKVWTRLNHTPEGSAPLTT